MRERLKRLAGHDGSRLIGGSAFIFFCRVFGAVIAFLTQVVLARWMGASALGEYVLAYSWLIMLAVFPVAGYSGAAMRFVTQGLADDDPAYAGAFVRHALRKTLTWSLVITFLGVALLLVAPSISSDERTLFLSALVGVPLMALIRFDTGVANAISRFALSFLPNNVWRPLAFLAGVTLAWSLQWGLDAVLAMQIHLLAIIVVVVPFTLRVRTSLSSIMRHPPAVTEDERIWDRTAMSLLVLGLFTNYFPELTVIGIGFFLPSADIAIYNAAFRLALLVYFGLFAVDAFSAPALAQHYRREERGDLIRVIRLTTRIRLFVALAAISGFLVFGQWVLGLFGPEFVRGYPLLIILSLAQLSQAAIGPAVRLLSISGFHRLGFYASVFAIAAWCVLAALLVPEWGVVGAALATTIALTAWCAILRQFVKRHLKLDVLLGARDLAGID